MWRKKKALSKQYHGMAAASIRGKLEESCIFRFLVGSPEIPQLGK